MNYKQSLEWMLSQLPMYQRIGQQAFKNDLTNTIALCNYLGNPQNHYKTIHVGGTNGKGSTSHMLASILQEAGYNVGLYTSPHLKDFRERIKVNGICIPKRNVSQFITKHKRFLEKQGLSFFEMTVGMAFHYFSEKKVDVAVIEVGLGGRLDSTNIIIPELSIITNIGWDHIAMLGETLPLIAQEKAGIIKKNIPVVVGEWHSETADVFLQKTKEMQSELLFASKENIDLPPYELKGNYQVYNVKTVIKSVDLLKRKGFKISAKNMQAGLMHVTANTGLQGRWQQLGVYPTIIADTAHNKDGLQITMSQINDYEFNKLHVVLGVVNDKDLETILPLFPKKAQYYFCQPNIPRALDKELLKTKAMNFGLNGRIYQSVKQAFKASKKNATKNDFIYIGGSTFVVAEIV
jgi:dihydrofolate synthase/folylpolyglutamate synthase